MSKIKITTLTPVHIGSGNLLQNNSDFVFFKNGKDHFLGIIDERKVLDLIGEKNIDNWVLSIQRNDNTIDMMRRYAPNKEVCDYTQREIQSFAGDIRANDTLKECIHNGLGIPYIPGSSLKGAIRTAITATLAKRNTSISNQPIYNIQQLAYKVEGDLFGKEPQESIFRFIQVGDAYFDKGCEIALRMIMSLNITQSNTVTPDHLWNQKPQVVETIAGEEEAICSIKIDTAAYQRAKREMSDLGSLPTDIQSIAGLFQLINAHTIQLIQEEIDYWEQIGKIYNGTDSYLEQMEEMLGYVQQCDEHSCVLRVGHSSGWRFITGAWGENLNCWSKIVDVARPGNKNKYSAYDFPKSRRTDKDGFLLGFVKLTLV